MFVRPKYLAFSFQAAIAGLAWLAAVRGAHRQMGTLSGSVSGPDRLARPGAVIEMSFRDRGDEEGPPGSGPSVKPLRKNGLRLVADASGNFSAVLGQGVWEVAANFGGIDSEKMMIVIEPGQTTAVSIRLPEAK
jgi:hypothetical protein